MSNADQGHNVLGHISQIHPALRQLRNEYEYRKSEAIVRAVLAMRHTLGKRVVVAGGRLSDDDYGIQRTPHALATRPAADVAAPGRRASLGGMAVA